MEGVKAMTTKELMEYEQVRDADYINKRIKFLVSLVDTYNAEGIDITKYVDELKQLTEELEQIT